MTNKKDDLYRKPLENVPPFEFNEHVARVFPDMIKRSVPGYDLLCALTGVISAKYAQPNSTIYDLGCSLGGGSLAMRHAISNDNNNIIAVDNSSSMLHEFEKILAKDPASIPLEFRCEDIRKSTIKNASVIALNFVLQFIPLEERNDLLEKIFAGLLPKGCLILAEKIQYTSEEENEFQIELHHEFKSLNGYNELEIANKRSALENVLIPEEISTHEDRLRKIGFSEVYVALKCFNFIAFVAIK